MTGVSVLLAMGLPFLFVISAVTLVCPLPRHNAVTQDPPLRRIEKNHATWATTCPETMDYKNRRNLHRGQCLASAHLDSLYFAAMNCINRENWIQAIVNFETILLSYPNYRDVLPHLANARANLLKTAKLTVKEPDPPANALTFTLNFKSGFYTMLFILACIFAYNLSSIRARYYLLTGKLGSAARVYERLLKTRTYNLRPYIALAEIYLKMGRKDDQALRIYSIVQKLNPSSGNLQEISAIFSAEAGYKSKNRKSKRPSLPDRA